MVAAYVEKYLREQIPSSFMAHSEMGRWKDGAETDRHREQEEEGKTIS